MGKILILDESTANKIAAGEVIERPASVVKELLENSIDAGATIITVEIANGGISLIKVTDNGGGIEEEDVRTAFERHATSKIRNAESLNSISTLGFRGEALSSIASVSKVVMSTRTAASSYGTRIVIEGGKVKETGKVGCPEGTSITVRELFYNTPARYKFLKKNSTEARYVTDVVNKIALGNPEVSIRYLSDSVEILHTPGNNDLLSTIFCIYGKQTAENCISIEGENETMKVEGFIGSPSIARSNRAGQSFFINGRYVKSSLLSSAVDEAYKTFIMKGRYPFAVIKATTSFELVDVNVHPTKLQVRFYNEQEVFRLFYHTIRNALMNAPGIGNADIIQTAAHPTYTGQTTANSYDADKISRQQAFVQESTQSERYWVISEGNWQEAATTDIETAVSRETLEADNERRILKEAIIIGQLFKTYLLFQHNDTLYILDQHAAHEKVIYERLMKEFENNTSLSQDLVAPVVIELSNSEIQFLEEKTSLFNDIGYIYEKFGNNSIIIRSVPYSVAFGSIKNEFLSLLGHLMEFNADRIDLMTQEALYRIACSSAVKAGNSMDKSEGMQLLKDLSMLDSPFTCPHGRPTVIKIEKEELERRFGRK